METMIQDLKYAARVLLKSPGFVLIAVLTLALGIGANTALFSVVNGVLLRPCLFRGRTNWWSSPRRPRISTARLSLIRIFWIGSAAIPVLRPWQLIAAMISASPAAEKPSACAWAWFPRASSRCWEWIRVAGALFTADDDRLGTAPVAMISAGLWQRKFGSAPDIIGKRITMNGGGYTVIGVVPASFQLESTNFGSGKDVFVPIGGFKDPLFQRVTCMKGCARSAD